MKKVFLVFALAVFCPPAFSQMNEKEKSAWTGGYMYGAASAACLGERSGKISKKERNYIVGLSIEIYKNKMSEYAYSPEVSPSLYRLVNPSYIESVCKEL